MEINEVKYGFKIKTITECKDINSTLYVYEHIKSGGQVMYLKNDDTNCVCAFGFRTLPEDSTGVCHIIEHSLLCGSKKYPLKEPFVNLIKGSLNTFLNAFTASDWTMYPFASQTPKDFDNILKIYADACFNPLSVIDEKPFLQEGWHLELNDVDATPCYKGVVYNEMKGAMSSVDRVLYQTTLEAMYKDNCYRFNSGGEPDDIPNLTYEAYKDFYRRHYTPQNCMTYFYGNLDIDEKLKFLDDEYFSKYDKSDKEIRIIPQKPLINLNHTKEYGIGEQEDTKDNTYIALCYGLDHYENYEEFLAMNIIVDSLLSSNDAPLKKALLDAKLGQDVDCSFDDDNIIPALHIQLQKTNPNKKEAFKKVFEDSVRKLINEGIDKELLLASINSFEFREKECDMGRMPKGIVYAMNMMGSFDYNCDLLSHLEYSKHYAKFKKELNNGYFEKLLEKYILNSIHNVEVMVTPSKTLSKEKHDKMNALMEHYKNTFSTQEKEELVAQTKKLIEYQNHVDTRAELKTMPTLKLKDIPMQVNYLDHKKCRVNGISGITHTLDTNKIAYLRMFFGLEKIAYNDLPYVTLLSSLFLNVSTTKYTSLKITSLIKTYLGSFNFSAAALPIDDNHCLPRFKLSVSAIEENVSYIPELINEVLLHSKFTKKEMKQAIEQNLIGLKQAIMGNGMAISMTMAKRSKCKDASVNVMLSASPLLYNFYKKLKDNFDYKKINEKLKDISKRIFNKKNCFFSISGDNETVLKTREILKELKLPRKEYVDQLEIKNYEPSNEALIIQSGVSYNAVANNYKKFNFTYDGKYVVASHIINSDYLWKEVRVKGGAYGCSNNIARASKTFALGSYRDPNVSNTYNVYNGVEEYLRTFKCSKDEFKSYIIGAMGGFDVPQSAKSFIDTWDTNYLIGYTKKDKIALKKQVLKTKIEDIREVSLMYAKLNNGASYYTIGNESKIKEHHFDKSETL